MEVDVIKKSILEIRGIKVILDYDLAKIYEVETRVLKQAVRRNIERFPEDFMFCLTKDEWQSQRSQIVMLENGKGKHPKYLPFAFTEQGVAMLSAVLNSQKAIETSIHIMRAFVMLRQFAMTYNEISEQLQLLEQRYDQKFNDVEEVLKYLLQKDKRMINQEERSRLGY